MESAQSLDQQQMQPTDEVPAVEQQEQQADRVVADDPPPQMTEPTLADAGARVNLGNVDIYEVKGSTGTLLQHLQNGTIAWPPLMEWRQWLSWRSREGMRPTARPDGYWTTGGYETHLYASIMSFKYGRDWRTNLRSSAPGILRKSRWASPYRIDPTATAEQPYAWSTESPSVWARGPVPIRLATGQPLDADGQPSSYHPGTASDPGVATFSSMAGNQPDARIHISLDRIGSPPWFYTAVTIKN